MGLKASKKISRVVADLSFYHKKKLKTSLATSLLALVILSLSASSYFYFFGKTDYGDDAASHSFILCEPSNPCCIDNIDESLTAIMDQTMKVGSVTVFHACKDTGFFGSSFKTKIADLISKEEKFGNVRYNKISKTKMYEQTCGKDMMLLCVLQRIDHLIKQGNQPRNIFVQLSSHAMDPIAHEHLLLYLEARPGLSAVRPLAHFGEEMGMTGQISNNKNCINPVPLMLRTWKFGGLGSQAYSKNIQDANSIAKMLFLKALTSARLVRTPLYKNRNFNLCFSYDDISITPQTEKYIVTRPYIMSDPDFYAWSSRLENSERYETWPLGNDLPVLDTGKMNFMFMKSLVRTRRANNRIMFFVPSLQMGGSEKSVFDIAQTAKNKGWDVSIILTMPEFDVDNLKEVALKNTWLHRARKITSDVFEILGIAQNLNYAKYLRYFLESRQPDYIFVSNAVSIYEHLQFIRSVVPNTFIVDFNHMIHPEWRFRDAIGAGGLPRMGSFFSEYIDLHFTASNYVSNAMRGWIEPDIISKVPGKVKTCYIGADPAIGSIGVAQAAIERKKWRSELGISEEKQVILFAGRFVRQKGIDVTCKVLKELAKDPKMVKNIAFVFAGTGPQQPVVQETIDYVKRTSELQVIMRNPQSIQNMYSMADVLFLPSRNEGIALVIYEALASGLLVVTTNVGGQKEIIDSTTGVLLPSLDSMENPTQFLTNKLKYISNNDYSIIKENGKKKVLENYTTNQFTKCIFDTMTTISMKKIRNGAPTVEETSSDPQLIRTTKANRADGMWKMGFLQRPVETIVTIGVKTYICDDTVVQQIKRLVRSVRTNYPKVRIILGNDGPLQISALDFMQNDPHVEEVMLQNDAGISVGRNAMVSMTKTEYFLLMDDDHVFDAETKLEKAITAMTHNQFEIVGFRVYNLPGIEDLEEKSIRIPKYVSTVSGIKNRNLTVCQWNENDGPSVIRMNYPIAVDVIHNAFIARTSTLINHPWRPALKVNEHMTFFLDAKKANVKVGYLPSVYVHHRRRRYTQCYWNARFREDKYQSILDYDAGFTHDMECENRFPQKIGNHLEKNQDKPEPRFHVKHDL